MSFKGSSLKVVEETAQYGIDGVTAISDIPAGYVIEAENVDLSQPGVIRKRAGYSLFGCKLPIRCRRYRYETAGLHILDYSPLASITLSFYENTTLNATATASSEIKRVADPQGTLFVKMAACGQVVTLDTLFEMQNLSPAPLYPPVYSRFFQPVAVFNDGSDGSNPTFLVPFYVSEWIGAHTDTVPSVMNARVCVGYTHPRITEMDIVSLSISAPSIGSQYLTITFEKGSVPENLGVGSIVALETCATKKTSLLLNTGEVVSVSDESIVAIVPETPFTEGEIEKHYFSMRYFTGGSLWIKSKDYDYFGYSGAGRILITGVNQVTMAIGAMLGVAPSFSGVNDYLFMYGLDISSGYVQLLNKYFDVASNSERIVCGVYGSLFAMRDNPTPILNTISPLTYVGPTSLLQADPTTRTVTIPLSLAGSVYVVGDEISLTRAVDTTGETITETYTVTEVNTNSIKVDAGAAQYIGIIANSKVRFRRKSRYIVLSGGVSATYYHLFNGCMVQIGEKDTSKPTHTVMAFSAPTAGVTLLLDTEVEWESDSYLSSMPLFLPVFQDNSLETYQNYDSTEGLGSFKDIQTAGLERSVILAAGKSGMWRFNGAQLLNMRIPTPTAGFIRNISGSGGTLKIDETDDGQKIGRFYRFYVSYSYSELVNGKLVRYESGLNPIGSYRITSRPAIDGSDTSQIVELQVATIPNGIGLPASDMTINVYRSPSGTASDVESDTEVLLKEVEAPNNPATPFIRVLAGIAPKLQFNEENYDFLYLSQGGDRATDESSRNIVDTPLAKVVTTQENRIVAANGWDWPYVNLICKRVFDPSTGSFAAHGRFTLVPPSTSETAYRFITCPCSLLTTSGTAGGAGGPTFQSIGIPTYAVKAIAYSDNSHLFKILLATITAGKKYVLRFANGVREAKAPGGKDPYFDGFGFEEQVFVGTATATQVSAQKKWTTTDTAGALKEPTTAEQVTVFEETQSITAPASDNGLLIEGNTGVGEIPGGAIRFWLKVKDTAVATYNVADLLILKGLGTTGQVRDVAGRILNWDTDIVAYVKSASTAGNPDVYEILVYVKGDTTNDFVPAQLKSAITVSNLSTGVTHGPFTIFKQMSATARTLDDFSLTPTTATIQLTTSPAIAPAAGTRICVDGLPEFIPANCEMNFNTNFEITNFAGDTFTVKVKAPPNMRGTGGQDFTGDPNPGKVGIPELAFETTPADVITLELNPTVMATAVTADDWVYMIVRGKGQDSYCMELTGWFKVDSVKLLGFWGGGIGVGQTLQAVKLRRFSAFLPIPIDYSAITGISETRIIFCGRNTIDGYTTINVPIPVPLSQRYDADVTGTFYGPYDGYTPLEKVSKRLAHAVSCVLHSSYWGYWGKFRPDLEREQDIPTNGCRIQPHRWPEDAHRYDNTMLMSTTGTNESAWKCQGEAGYWKVEGEDIFEPTLSTPVSTYTAKKYRPSRVYWTNKAGSAEGVSFRELSVEEIDSDDGDEIVGMAPFQTYSIAAKRDSVWRLGFRGGTVLSTEKVPSTVGAASAKNMVATERGVFFLHESGVYITDGALVEPILQTSRYFNSRVVQNKDLFGFTAGHHNPLGKTVYLGVPLSNSEGELASGVSGQFVFNYSLRNVTLNTIDYGWSVNTQIPATVWTRIKTEDFFASDTGNVYKIRMENGPTRFSDVRAGIPFKVSTRYIDSQDPIDFKFYRSLFFQFGKETSANMKVSLAWDFAKDYTLVSTIPIMQEGFGTAPFGTSYWGCDRYIETIRRTPVQPRVAQLSIRLENDEVDTATEVYGIFLESSQITSKLHKQPGV